MLDFPQQRHQCLTFRWCEIAQETMTGFSQRAIHAFHELSPLRGQSHSDPATIHSCERSLDEQSCFQIREDPARCWGFDPELCFDRLHAHQLRVGFLSRT